MQSPTGVVFRTLVMLACLVAIPMAALFGSSLPRMLTAVLEGRCPIGIGRGAKQQDGRSEPTTVGANGAIIGSPAEPAAPPWQAHPPTHPDMPGTTLEPMPSAVTPAAYQTAVGFPAEGSEAKAAVATAPPVSPVGQDTGMCAAVAGGPRASDLPMQASWTSGEEKVAQTDNSTQIQQRLHQLGATYFLLETWGNRRELYRFCCEVPINGSSGFVRHFEATHAEPIEAMTRVLQEVESCQIARQ
jgi:hypothetical protein